MVPARSTQRKCLNEGATWKHAMPYRINAMFNDGCLLFTDLCREPTPVPNERIFVRRGDRVVEGVVIIVRRSPFIFTRGPVRVIDEVVFREIAKVIQFPTNALAQKAHSLQTQETRNAVKVMSVDPQRDQDSPPYD
jgi:hypothetical protein